MTSNNHILIVAGGSGSRIKQSIPKQFIEINNKPLIIYTIEKFLAFDPAINIYISVHSDYAKHMNELAAKYFPDKTFHITNGGETRFHSVKNGLSMVTSQVGIIGIHDAARPLVSIETIKKCFALAEIVGNAVPAVSVSESLRKISSTGNETVNRNEYKIIQTPQCFSIPLIKKSFEQNYDTAFTDDASVMEKSGVEINLVEGNTENIKITYPIDLIIAGHYLS